MIRHLPARTYLVLEAAGRLADEMGLPVFLVGGIARDLLLGTAALDLDLVIEGDGILFARAFARSTGGRATVHDQFGTATVTLDDGQKLDIATARKESYGQPAALPLVVPAPIEEDLLRRDFTINALAIRINALRFGELMDICGGLGDISAKRIRVLHSRSFLDDPARVFRAIRFEHRLGFRMDRPTRALLRDAIASGVIARLSGHRLSEELRLLFSEASPRRAIARMGELGVLRAIHPKLTWSGKMEGRLKAVERAAIWHVRTLPEPGLKVWLLPVMAMLEELSRKSASDVLKRLALPAQEAEAIHDGHGHAGTVLRRLQKQPAPKPSVVNHVLGGFAEETVVFFLASAKSESVERSIRAYMTTYRHIQPTATGADLKALGLMPGPQFRRILDRLRDARLDGYVGNEADERRLLKKLAGG